MNTRYSGQRLLHMDHFNLLSCIERKEEFQEQRTAGEPRPVK
jgi:hypothetical protein